MGEVLTINYQQYRDAVRVKKTGVLLKSPLWRRILCWLGLTRFGRWEVHYWYTLIPPSDGPPEYWCDGVYLMPDGSLKSVRQLQKELDP